MEDTTYEGYTNYETWEVSLYINNNEPAYRRVQNTIKRLQEQGLDQNGMITEMKHWLRVMFSSVIKTGRRKINWLEIATDEVECFLFDQKAYAKEGLE